MNLLIQSIAHVCEKHLLDEKWLVAPSLRAGYQWLDCVSRTGVPVVNLHVKTLERVARDIASPVAFVKGKRILSDLTGAVLVERIWRDLEEEEERYLRSIQPSWELHRSVYSTLKELRMAGVDLSAIPPRGFEAPSKGVELRLFLRKYLDHLASRNWLDIADLFQLAIERAGRECATLFEGVLVLLPAEVEFHECERRLVSTIPESNRLRLEVDPPWNTPPKDPAEKPEGASQSLFFSLEESAYAFSEPVSPPPNLPLEGEELLSPLPFREGSGEGIAEGALPNTGSLKPYESAATNGTPSIRIFRAVGEVNEVREVLRRCLSGPWKLDEVEVLHTDRETYVPLIHETLQSIGDRVPVTFEEGIPVRFSRPGRALEAWLRWVGEGHLQTRSIEMLREGLLAIQGSGGKSFHSLANTFATVRIVFGRGRYESGISKAISALEERIESPSCSDENDGGGNDRTARLVERLTSLRLLQQTFRLLMEISPSPRKGENPREILDFAVRFSKEIARAADEVDNYAVEAIVRRIDEFRNAIPEDDDRLDLDIWKWLRSMLGEVRIMGSRPKPGHLHVAHLLSGGHSGRPSTYILGLDDSRFPGAGLQDPVLLDSERERLSKFLPTASRQLSRKIREFWLLLGRLRGEVTLGYSSLNVVDHREMFPSPLLLDVFRSVSENPAGNLKDFLDCLHSPSSFTPEGVESCVNENEMWLWHLCGEERVTNADELLARRFLHLQRGWIAASERISADFTVFDGHIPHETLDEASVVFDPTLPEGPIVSPSRLEIAGRCPLAYFFNSILGITLPEDVSVDPSRWLAPMETGELLHEVFRQFMANRIEKGELPNLERDETEILGILDAAISRFSKRYPAPSESVFQQECVSLRRAVRIFLGEEEEFCKTSHPVRLEFGFGLPPSGTQEEDTIHEPVEIPLSEEKSIRVRGRIDRIDRTGPRDGSGQTQSYSVWDYKTGRAGDRYKTNPPFNQGRILQHFLYLSAAEVILPRLFGPLATTAEFGYFFPGEKGAGERLRYKPARMMEGRQIVLDLCKLLGSGCFVATNSSKDCDYCDYSPICGDVEAVTSASCAKIRNAKNTLLEPFRKLRGIDAE